MFPFIFIIWASLIHLHLYFHASDRYTTPCLVLPMDIQFITLCTKHVQRTQISRNGLQGCGSTPYMACFRRWGHLKHNKQAFHVMKGEKGHCQYQHYTSYRVMVGKFAGFDWLVYVYHVSHQHFGRFRTTPALVLRIQCRPRWIMISYEHILSIDGGCQLWNREDLKCRVSRLWICTLVTLDGNEFASGKNMPTYWLRKQHNYLGPSEEIATSLATFLLFQDDQEVDSISAPHVPPRRSSESQGWRVNNSQEMVSNQYYLRTETYRLPLHASIKFGKINAEVIRCIPST